jgi:hypothetical protein
MEQIEDTVKEKTTTKKRGYKKPVFFVVSSLLLIVVVLASYAGYVYAMSPAIIREPALEHYHFRMQIIVDGKAEDFSSEGYQTGYAKDQCNANLPEQPIHFHDNKDQFTHVHWEGMTGGMVMKYYGWNYIGGVDNALGYKLDDLSDIQKVTTHGDYLPKLANDSKFFIYTGDESSYQERTFDDWKNLDLENFFGTTSNFPAHKINTEGGETSFLDKLLPKASAHDGVDDGNDGEPGEETEEEKLTRINNLVGNVVIFAQKDAPSEQQIKDRFNNLEPLADSTCGG